MKFFLLLSETHSYRKTNERGIEWRNKKGKVIGQQVN